MLNLSSNLTTPLLLIAPKGIEILLFYAVILA